MAKAVKKAKKDKRPEFNVTATLPDGTVIYDMTKRTDDFACALFWCGDLETKMEDELPEGTTQVTIVVSKKVQTDAAPPDPIQPVREGEEFTPIESDPDATEEEDDEDDDLSAAAVGDVFHHEDGSTR